MPLNRRRAVASGAVELLRTPRLQLRRWRAEDLVAFSAIYSRDEVMRWLGPHPRRALATVAEAEARLQHWHRREAALVPPLGLWALVPRDGTGDQIADRPSSRAGDEPVGTILLMPLLEDGRATTEVEIGWHLHPDHQGRGLATEGARAVLERAAEAGTGDVLALTDLDNAESQAVATRLGMSDEGTTSRWFGLTTRQYRWRPPGRVSG